MQFKNYPDREDNSSALQLGKVISSILAALGILIAGTGFLLNKELDAVITDIVDRENLHTEIGEAIQKTRDELREGVITPEHAEIRRQTYTCVGILSSTNQPTQQVRNNPDMTECFNAANTPPSEIQAQLRILETEIGIAQQH